MFAQVLGEEHYNIHGSDDYLLDPGSVVADKLESGRQLNIIGWLFDLDLRSVFTNGAKLVVKDMMSLKILQKLASWEKIIFDHLRPY
jgi:hypothetical protein